MISKVNLFPAITAHFLLIFLSNWSNAEEVAFVAYLSKPFLAKGIARSISAFLPKLPITLTKVLPIKLIQWIILGNWALLSFIYLLTCC